MNIKDNFKFIVLLMILINHCTSFHVFLHDSLIQYISVSIDNLFNLSFISWLHQAEIFVVFFMLRKNIVRFHLCNFFWQVFFKNYM